MQSDVMWHARTHVISECVFLHGHIDVDAAWV